MNENAELQRLHELIQATDFFFGGGRPGPEAFEPRPGESVYLAVPYAELVELHVSRPPLVGGRRDFGFASAQALRWLVPGTPRSISLKEDVPARDAGPLVVTDQRVVLLGHTRVHDWDLDELVDVTHDQAVPETWFAVRSRPQLSGIRYDGAAATDVRFSVALAVATSRQDRAALRASLGAQATALSPGTQAGGWGAAAAPADTAGIATGPGAALTRWLRLAYLGKPGAPLPARLAQGTLVALLTLGLVGSVLSSGNGGSAVEARNVAAEQAEADSAAAARAAAEQAAAEREAARAAEQEAQREAAEQEAVEAERAAAAQAAAERAAAEQAAAEQAAAQRAEAERAAAERAAAERAAAEQAAARAEAERQAQAAQQRASSGGGTGCTPAYPDFCIPAKAGDAYNCSDFTQKRFTALAPDPYRLDRDNDGVACES